MATVMEPVAPSVLLYALADAVGRAGMPDPERMYQTPDRRGCDINPVTREDFDRWCAYLGIDAGDVRSQSYDRDDVPKILTTAYGRWLGWSVYLSCCVPANSATTAVTVAA